MTREPKITDKQLKKELEKNKKIQEIRRQYGYSEDSGNLRRRIKKLEEITRNNEFSLNENGATPYIPRRIVEKAVKIKNISKESNRFFYNPTVSSDGDIILVLNEQKWREKD